MVRLTSQDSFLKSTLMFKLIKCTSFIISVPSLAGAQTHRGHSLPSLSQQFNLSSFPALPAIYLLDHWTALIRRLQLSRLLTNPKW